MYSIHSLAWVRIPHWEWGVREGNEGNRPRESLHSLSVSRDFSSTKWMSLTVRGVSSVGGISNEGPSINFWNAILLNHRSSSHSVCFLSCRWLVHYKRNVISRCQLIGRTKNPYSSVTYLWIIGYDTSYTFYSSYYFYSFHICEPESHLNYHYKVAHLSFFHTQVTFSWVQAYSSLEQNHFVSSILTLFTSVLLIHLDSKIVLANRICFWSRNNVVLKKVKKSRIQLTIFTLPSSPLWFWCKFSCFLCSFKLRVLKVHLCSPLFVEFWFKLP